MDRQQRFDVPLRAVLILRLDQHRYDCRMPVIAVDDVGAKVYPCDRFHNRPAEIGILFSFCFPAPVYRSSEIGVIVCKIIGDTVLYELPYSHILVPPAHGYLKFRHNAGLFIMLFFYLAVERQNTLRPPQSIQIAGSVRSRQPARLF